MTPFWKKMGALQIWLLTGGAILLVLGMWLKDRLPRSGESSMPMALMVEDMSDEGVTQPPSQTSTGVIHTVELDQVPPGPRRDGERANGLNGGPVVTAPSQMLPAQTGMQGCAFDSWVGQNVETLPLEGMERPYRVLPPGAMITMDFVEDRINIETDDSDIVTRVTCG